MGNNLKLYDLWKRQSHEVLNDLYHEVYGALQPLPRKRREIKIGRASCRERV